MPRQSEPTERLCIVTRSVRPVDELIRFVLDPDGRVVPDIRRRLPGRGVWVSASAAAVREAERRKLFGRAFKTSVTVEPGLDARVAERLAAAALGALGMARKAGQVVTGFAKVEAAVAAGKAAGVLHAAEAAEDGVRKLDAAIRRNRPEGGLPVVRRFGADQLGLAIGGANVIHAALLAGRLGEEVLGRIAALARFVDGESGERRAIDGPTVAMNVSAGRKTE